MGKIKPVWFWEAVEELESVWIYNDFVSFKYSSWFNVYLNSLRSQNSVLLQHICGLLCCLFICVLNCFMSSAVWQIPNKSWPLLQTQCEFPCCLPSASRAVCCLPIVSFQPMHVVIAVCDFMQSLIPPPYGFCGHSSSIWLQPNKCLEQWNNPG